jgi:TonB family protein
MTGERALLPIPSHPRLPHTTSVHDIRDSWATPVIGNPGFGFAAPLTFSLNQPSRPVELRIGDFGVPTSAVGSPHAGHGPRNGFLETGFGGGGVDRKPVRIISKPTPKYTEDARNKKIEGDVVIDLIFTADRRIVVLRILHSIGYGLDEIGVQAVSQIVFRPASANGRAVDFQGRARVEFRLVECAIEEDQLSGSSTQED